jgi:hypothetical protein
MGSACACTTPTGAKGEALTFTRTGNATCSRSGLATTGIQNGDLVTCAANQPRVEPSGGVLGLRVEGARTNEILRSQEIDNAAWTSGAVGVAAPTVTANAATAPDGTVTAERLQVPLTTAAQYSYRLQTGAAASQHTASIYVRGNGTSGTMHLWAGTTPNSCVLCSYVSGSWSRCSTTTPGSATYGIGFGNDSTNAVCVAAGAALSALDVFVWQGQVESSAAYATSYIPTVASATTRNAESATFPVALSTANNFSWAESLVSPSTLSACAGFFPFFSSPNGPVLYSCFNTGIIARVQEAANVADSPTCVFSAFKWQTGVRWGGVWNRSASTTQCHVDGVTGAAGTPNALVGSVSFSPVGLNSGADGIHSRVCVDPDPTRCR